jgi:phage terminase large subunit-like protein
MVVAGAIITGRLVRLACRRHLRDLEEGPKRGLRWDPAASERAIDFFRFLRHFEGPKAGKPVELELWQCFAIGSVFGWKRADGTRRFRRAFTEIGKKNGKSLIAAGLAILLAFFDGEAGAQVYAAATKREQARIVWNAAKVMVEKSPDIRRRIRTRALSIFSPRTLSFFRPLSKETKGEDGINPHGVIVDEIHRIEDRGLYDLLGESFGARAQPLFYQITTAGSVGPSVWAEEHDYAAKVLEGIIDDDALFAYIANLDPDDDPFDEAVWIKANPNLGVSVRIDDMRERAQEARNKPGKLNSFLRLRLNKRTQSETAWMTPEQWTSNGDQPKALAGRTAYAGLDLGSRSDLAALIVVTEETDDAGELEAIDVHCRFWVPIEAIAERTRRDRVPYQQWVDEGWILATPGNVTDYDAIRIEINRLGGAEELPADLEDDDDTDDDAGGQGEPDWADIYEIGYDPHDATQLSTQLQADGFRLVRVMQSTGEMDAPVKEIERLISARKLRHGNNPVLGWMVSNTVMVADAAGRRRPDKEKAREKIDGVPALLMAIKRWMANAGGDDEWTAE